MDAVRLVPGQDATEVTATQIREVFGRLQAAGQWCQADPPVLVVLDAGYDVIRLAFLLADLPIRLLGRVRSDRVFHAPASGYAGNGRPGRHGPAMKLEDPATWPAAEQTMASTHERYGQVAVTAWGHHHPQLQRRAGWATYPGALPLVEGTLILIRVDRLPGDTCRDNRLSTDFRSLTRSSRGRKKSRGSRTRCVCSATGSRSSPVRNHVRPRRVASTIRAG